MQLDSGQTTTSVVRVLIVDDQPPFRAAARAVIERLRGFDVVAGRSSWKAISDRVPLAFVAPLAVDAIALDVARAFVVANALAIVPARRAGRLRPAYLLRPE